MSTTDSGTSYTVQVSLGPADGGTLYFGADEGVTDDLMLQVVQALNALPWPGGAKVATANKTASESTYYAADLAQTPPAFV